MARKKRAVRRGSHCGTHTNRSDHTHSSPSQSSTNSSPSSPTNPDPNMARTKITARHPSVAPHRPGIAPRPTLTLPNTSQPSSSKPSSFRGKRPLHEDDKEIPSSQTRHTRGTVIDFPLRSISEPKLSNLITYKSFYAEFFHESFDRRRFQSLMNYIFFYKNIYKRTLCPSKLVNLDKLHRKGLNFTPLFACQRWIPILYIKKKIYPDPVKQFYSNLSYKEGRIASFVKVKKTVPKRRQTDDSTDVSSVDEYPLIPPSTSTTIKVMTRILKNVLEEFINLTNLLLTHGAERKKKQVMEENALKKTKGRIRILRDFVEDVEVRLTTTDNEGDDDGTSDESKSDA
ncbi:hypothetical protein HN51_022637 [Arachis hypogaea]